MENTQERKKWEQHQLKQHKIFKEGILNNKIIPYDLNLIQRLRTVYFENIPASIWLLCGAKCDHCCYDLAILITLGFGDDDFLLIDANVDSIALNPSIVGEISKNKQQNINYANHRIALRKCIDGSLWVYDTSRGLVFDRQLYFELENPQVTAVIKKQDVLDASAYKALKNTTIDIEEAYKNLEEFEQFAQDETLYKSELKTEIELFKIHLEYLSHTQKKQK